MYKNCFVEPGNAEACGGPTLHSSHTGARSSFIKISKQVIIGWICLIIGDVKSHWLNTLTGLVFAGINFRGDQLTLYFFRRFGSSRENKSPRMFLEDS